MAKEIKGQTIQAAYKEAAYQMDNEERAIIYCLLLEGWDLESIQEVITNQEHIIMVDEAKALAHELYDSALRVVHEFFEPVTSSIIEKAKADAIDVAADNFLFLKVFAMRVEGWEEEDIFPLFNSNNESAEIITEAFEFFTKHPDLKERIFLILKTVCESCVENRINKLQKTGKTQEFIDLVIEYSALKDPTILLRIDSFILPEDRS